MPRKKREASTVEIGVPGLTYTWGRMNEERHPRLQGTAAARVYEEMRDNDAIIGAALYSIEAYLRSVKWFVRAADDSEEAEAEAEFLETCMNDMDSTWDEFISDVLSLITYGYSLHEIVYKVRRGLDAPSKRFRSRYSDGRVGWRNLALRAQRTIDRWEIADDGEILGAYQKNPNTGVDVFLPMSRCVLFRTKTYKNNPEGVSVLRRAYRSWYFKKRLEEIEAVGISRDMTGVPLVEVPAPIMSPNATAAQRSVRSQMEMLVSQLHRDEREGIVFPAETDFDGKPTGYKIRLLSSPGSKQIPADPVIRRNDSRIAMTLAAEFLMLGTEKTGSFALAAEKSSNFVKSLEWYADTICSMLNKVAVARLMEVNGVDETLWPRIEHGPIAQHDIKDLGLFLQQISMAGLITPSVELEKHLRHVAKFPDMTSEEEDLVESRVDAKAKETDNGAIQSDIETATAINTLAQPMTPVAAPVEPPEPAEVPEIDPDIESIE